MTEGGPRRMKHMDTRLFKNPPQPHMCIQDFIEGDTEPCYVNVLSWERIAAPFIPSQPVPLYGGMRVRPPRTKAETVIFAVMAHPQVLRMNGKNSEDPEKRATLITLLLDFVESMNTGIVFMRQYTVLKDRDIAGELKEVWNAVQAREDREQLISQQETWIDAQPPVPQYPQYQEQQQQQQAQHEYNMRSRQCQPMTAYDRQYSGNGMHYDGGGYGHQTPNQIITQNDQMYQTGHIVPQQYHGNVPRLTQDPYDYRDRGREAMMQNIPQQNCPAYPGPYQFQQLRSQLVPQYENSNMHPNAPISYGPPGNANAPPPIVNSNLDLTFMVYDLRQSKRRTRKNYGKINSQANRQDTNNSSPLDNNKPTIEKGNLEEPKNVQVTDLDDDVKSSVSTEVKSPELSKKLNHVNTPETPVTIAIRENANPSEKIIQPSDRQQEEKKTEMMNGQNSLEQKNSKPEVFVIKVHKPKDNYESNKNRGRGGSDHKTDSPKRGETTTEIFKRVFKIHSGVSGDEPSGKRKSNGQTKGNGRNVSENGDAQPGYTILKKPDSTTQAEVVSEIAKISIQDCKDAGEVSPPLS